jgi:hypothetical protein
MASLHDSINFACNVFASSSEFDGKETVFKNISNDEVDILISQGNTSSNWSIIFMHKDSGKRNLHSIKRCSFEGEIYISRLTGYVDSIDGIRLPAGLYDSNFSGKCFISERCRVSNTTTVRNVFIGEGASVINCGLVSSQEFSQQMGEHFTQNIGGQLTIDVGPETGGRSVVVSPGMNYAAICNQLFKGKDTVTTASDASRLCCSRYSIIGEESTVVSCDKISNSLLGPNCKISSSTLDNCTLLSTSSNPISVSAGARLSHCIMNESCTASSNCHAEFVYMSEHSSIGDYARVTQSVLGPDSSVAGGECSHSLLGPFVGFHHQCLLIATVWPQGRGNLAYGSMVGANHTGRVSDQECWPGEGIFFGLGSAVKFPCNLTESPYSIIASGTVLPPQKISFPFSLVSTLDRPLKRRDGMNSHSAVYISPGWILKYNPYMIDR